MPQPDAMRQPFFRHRPLVEPTPANAQATDRAPTHAFQENWSSDQLLAGRNEISITHGDSTYRLRLTSLGKLILTK